MTGSIRLDGSSLTRAQLVSVARGASVELDDRALRAMQGQPSQAVAELAR